jgi:chromosome segregation ATPase
MTNREALASLDRRVGSLEISFDEGNSLGTCPECVELRAEVRGLLDANRQLGADRDNLQTENNELREANRGLRTDCDKLRAENQVLREAKERLVEAAKAAWRVHPPCDCKRVRVLNAKLLTICRSAKRQLESTQSPNMIDFLGTAIAEAEEFNRDHAGSSADDADVR